MALSKGLPDPLHQFKIHKLYDLTIAGVDVAFTNASLYMLITVCAILGFMMLGLRKPQVIPNKAQVVCEMAYDFVGEMLHSNAGSRGKSFFSFVFSLFFFVLFGNLFGMLPYAYTFTSQIIVTFSLAMFVFLVVTFLGLAKHGGGFFNLFVPKGLPRLLYPLVIAIELLSYLSRPVTLAVRLFANMMAGHTILKVFAGFSFLLSSLTGILPIDTFLGLLPAAINVMLIGFEFLVAVLQAYVFSVLTCIYLHEALYLH